MGFILAQIVNALSSTELDLNPFWDLSGAESNPFREALAQLSQSLLGFIKIDELEQEIERLKISIPFGIYHVPYDYLIMRNPKSQSLLGFILVKK